MRCQANRVIVLWSAKPERPRSDFFQNFDKGTNARIVCGLGFFHSGSARLQSRYNGFGRFSNQPIGVFAKTVGVGMRAAGEFPAAISQAMRRPIAGAMMRSSAINCVNVAGSNDCAPSESA